MITHQYCVISTTSVAGGAGAHVRLRTSTH